MPATGNDGISGSSAPCVSVVCAGEASGTGTCAGTVFCSADCAATVVSFAAADRGVTGTVWVSALFGEPWVWFVSPPWAGFSWMAEPLSPNNNNPEPSNVCASWPAGGVESSCTWWDSWGITVFSSTRSCPVVPDVSDNTGSGTSKNPRIIFSAMMTTTARTTPISMCLVI